VTMLGVRLALLSLLGVMVRGQAFVIVVIAHDNRQ